MIFRFSLYSFLKNQRYFEPFLLLVFLEKGLDYFLIGLLIGFRELMVNLMEVPSGAAADILGRRYSMILSFLAYIAAFLVFGSASSVYAFFPAMLLYAMGDVFRSGTHKAMIFAWLKDQDRISEKTKIYGFTRSWGKIGSAISGLLGALFVFMADSYTNIFYYTIIPYLIGLINFLGYPKTLDGKSDDKSMKAVLKHMAHAVKTAATHATLRRLVTESMGFGGMFTAVKDYLQPILKNGAVLLAAGIPILAGLSETRQSALVIGVVYFGIYLAAAAASRNAHRVVDWFGNEETAAHRVWLVTTAIYGVMVLAGWWSLNWALVAVFVGLHVLQNIWRPILVSRFDNQGEDGQGATVLSIESQSRKLATMVVAPVLGFAVDWVRQNEMGGHFWPIGALGLMVALFFSLRRTS